MSETTPADVPAPERPTSVLKHEALGDLRGLAFEDGTKQYRGIKYASIPGRWQESVLHSQRLGENEFDATKFGPSCPQKAGGMKFDIGLVGDVELEHEEETYSELECLNLVITTPPGEAEKPEKLPVIVWVHGGGFSIGSNSWPQYDLRRIVSLSARLGKPVIGVSFNYRLNFFGFLASDELSIKGNYGLKDQAVAFNWIQKHIAGFGGDPMNVTAFGESAGAICLSTQLCTKESLFKRAILMSGDTTLRRIRKSSWQKQHYENNVKLLGLDSSTPEERIAALKTMTAEDIVAKLPITQHWSPAVESGYLEEIDLGALSKVNNTAGKPSWCQEIIVGDTAQDGTILKSRFLDDSNAMKRVYDAVAQTFSFIESEEILEAYNLTLNSTPETRYLGLTQIVSDLRFYLPVLKVVEGWQNEKNSCYRYHFHELNPVKGTYSDKASHELDVGFLLQNFNDHFPEAQVKLAEQMADLWLNFAYGRGGWPSDGSDKRVLVIGPEGKTSFTTPEEYDIDYRHGHGALMLRLGWQRCFKLGELLQGCWSED